MKQFTWQFWIVGLAFLPWLFNWGFWLLQAILAALPPLLTKAANKDSSSSLRIDVLIPAHNEELLLSRLLASVRDQSACRALNTVLVVADHCTDSTAQIARDFGFQVLERHSGPRGKPAAVRDGLAFLAAQNKPADAVLFLDADCLCSSNLLEALLHGLAAGYQVQQAVYLLESAAIISSAEAGIHNVPTRAASPAGPKKQLSDSVSFGFLLKNFVRPAGLARLGLPCPLFGSGMLFSENVLAQVSFEDHLIEDLRMAHTLLEKGIGPHFVTEARVTSPAPQGRDAITKQRLRWEGGVIQIWKHVFPLAAKLLFRGRIPSLIALLEWSFPPLAMGAAAWFLAALALAILVILKLLPPLAFIWPAIAATCLAGYIVIGITSVSGFQALCNLLAGAPGFIFWKAQLYTRMAAGRGATSWERTPRAAAPTFPASSITERHD